jgi:membrane protease YdiL (CAAX protease family)
LLLFAATYGVIPFLKARMDVELILLWFAAGGLIVFAPLVLAAVLMLRQEGLLGKPGVWRERMRFRPMTGTDWLWSLGGLVAIGVLAAGSLTGMRLLWGEVHLHPSFLSMDPLTPDRYWILAVWLPFWVVNILGEEVLWRGVVLPRQEAAFGNWAWLIQGLGWLLFHLPFGPAIMLTVTPTIFILPYVAQQRRNSWTGVVIHAGLNGPGFIAVAFGLV